MGCCKKITPLPKSSILRTNEVIGTIPEMGAEETESAILAAHRAQQDWAEMTAYARSNIMHKWSDLINQNKQELANLITIECGKPLKESLTEANTANIEWNAEEIKRSYGRLIPSDQKTEIL